MDHYGVPAQLHECPAGNTAYSNEMNKFSFGSSVISFKILAIGEVGHVEPRTIASMTSFGNMAMTGQVIER